LEEEERRRREEEDLHNQRKKVLDSQVAAQMEADADRIGRRVDDVTRRLERRFGKDSAERRLLDKASEVKERKKERERKKKERERRREL
jgi:hypothetical protein